MLRPGLELAVQNHDRHRPC